MNSLLVPDYEAAPPPAVLVLLSRKWRAIAMCAVGGAVIAVLAAFLVPSRYTANATFVPDMRDASRSGDLGSLAMQLGVVTSSGPTPQFYVNLSTSRSMMESLLGQQNSSTHAPLVDYFVHTSHPTPLQLEHAVQQLRAAISVGADPKTGIVSLSATAKDPRVAADIANALVAELQRFNVERRKSQASARRRFVEVQWRDSQDSLDAAEHAAESFLQANRSYQSSPELTFAYARLQRQVSMFQELATGLRRDLDQARIDEVNDTPVITVIDSASAPVSRSFPSKRSFALAGLFLGALLAFGFFYWGLRTARPA